jgi:hypothetical protein
MRKTTTPRARKQDQASSSEKKGLIARKQSRQSAEAEPILDNRSHRTPLRVSCRPLQQPPRWVAIQLPASMRRLASLSASPECYTSGHPDHHLEVVSGRMRRDVSTTAASRCTRPPVVTMSFRVAHEIPPQGRQPGRGITRRGATKSRHHLRQPGSPELRFIAAAPGAVSHAAYPPHQSSAIKVRGIRITRWV